jgi:tetratricopeptide (TPR) repeat protein
MRSLPLFFVALLSAPVALADGALEPAPDRVEAARFFRDAEDRYAAADFLSAIELYSAAYRAAADPAFLYNIAQCYRRLGDTLTAAELFERYLEEAPESEARQLITEGVTLLRQTAPTLRLTAPLLPKPRAPLAALELSLPAPEVAPETPVRRPLTARWWFWSSVGFGALASVGGVLALALSGPGVPNTALGHQDAFRE